MCVFWLHSRKVLAQRIREDNNSNNNNNNKTAMSKTAPGLFMYRLSADVNQKNNLLIDRSLYISLTKLLSFDCCV